MLSTDQIAKLLQQIDESPIKSTDMETTLLQLATDAVPQQKVVVAKIAARCMLQFGNGKSVVEQCWNSLQGEDGYRGQLLSYLANCEMKESHVSWLHGFFAKAREFNAIDNSRFDSVYNTFVGNFSEEISRQLADASAEYLLNPNRGPGMYNTDSMMQLLKVGHRFGGEFATRITDWIDQDLYRPSTIGFKEKAGSEGLDILLSYLERCCYETFNSPHVKRIRNAIWDRTCDLMRTEDTKRLGFHYLGSMLHRDYTDAASIFRQCMLIPTLPTFTREFLGLYVNGWCDLPIQNDLRLMSGDDPRSDEVKLEIIRTNVLQGDENSKAVVPPGTNAKESSMHRLTDDTDENKTRSIKTKWPSQKQVTQWGIGKVEALDLGTLTRLRMSEAKNLSRHCGELNLDGLSHISGLVAYRLARASSGASHYSRDRLSLLGIANLSDSAAYYLASGKRSVKLMKSVVTSEYGRRCLAESANIQFV
jgi:hypothetical protein